MSVAYICLVIALTAATTTARAPSTTTTTATTTSPPARYNVSHKFMGWYGDEGYASELAGWNNAYLSQYEADLVTQHHVHNFTQQLLSITSVFVKYNYSRRAFYLRPDMHRMIEAKKPLWTELLRNRTIVGFFLGDEIMWNGFPYTSLVEYSNAIRKAFPSAFLWQNEAPDVYEDLKKYNITDGVPPAIDAISIDKYHWEMSDREKFVLTTIRGYYDTYIKPQLHPGQKLFVVPGADGSHTNKKCNMTCYNYIVAQDSHWFLKWMQEDELVIGAMPWSWKSCGAGCASVHDEVGCRMMQGGKAAWEKNGKLIIDLPL
jgi:hypothetical protein